MHPSNRHRDAHNKHIWIPWVDTLLIVVATLVLLRDSAGSQGPQQAPLYRSLEDADLAQASSDGGTIPKVDSVIKLDSSGQVILNGEKMELSELRRHLGPAPVLPHFVLAVADTAHAGDAERVELILRDAKVNYTRLFKKQSNP